MRQVVIKGFHMRPCDMGCSAVDSDGLRELRCLSYAGIADTLEVSFY